VLRGALEALSVWAVPLLVAGIPAYALTRRVKVYPVFVEGAKEGFQIAVRVIPPLVAVVVALGMLRASGAMDGLAALLAPVTAAVGIPASVLPMVLVRPLSGGAALGVVADVLRSDGPETTFYVLAVYFGAIGITRYRQALPAALLADLAGFAASVAAVRFLFGP
jgi:spore maturation protein B